MTNEAFKATQDQVWYQLAGLHDTWQQYLDLFAHSDERIALLNRTARWFFAGVERRMVREVLLGVCRLTDRSMMRGRANLVLAVLLEDPAFERHPTLRAKLEADLLRIRERVRPIRTHRNRQISHLDRDTLTGAAKDPLPPLTRQAIEAVLGDMEAFCREYALVLHETDSTFEVHALGTTRDLIAALERGELQRREEMRRLREQAGLPPEEDGP